jgi:transcriptional accessory protein Tex/SPT6
VRDFNSLISEDEDEEAWHPEVLHVPDRIASIYAKSSRANTEFPDYAHNLRKAISLGRFAQDPLSELT